MNNLPTMNKFQFIKHPIKENDTIESVAQHFGITTNYVQLVHNLNVDVYDKIKSTSGFFPSHLKEIFITEETYQSYIDRENEKRPKNNPILQYNPIKDKTIYQVVYTVLDGEDQNQISFQTSVQGLKSNPKINGHIVEVDRTTSMLINDAEPEFAIDELALATEKVIYPLQIVLNYSGKFVKIFDYEQIVKRWELVKENIRDNFESEQTERYILYTETMLQTEATLLASLQKDWFLKAFFSEIYIDYYHQYKIKKSLQFPILSDLENHKFSIIQEMNPYADDELPLSITQTGTLATDDTNSINGTFEAKYLLDPIDKTIKNITLESSLDLNTSKKLAITITKKQKV